MSASSYAPLLLSVASELCDFGANTHVERYLVSCTRNRGVLTADRWYRLTYRLVGTLIDEEDA